MRRLSVAVLYLCITGPLCAGEALPQPSGSDIVSPVTFCEEYLRSTPRDEIDPDPLLTGDDLIAAGFAPGPSFKKILEIVRDAQLNGEITDRHDALHRAGQLLQDPDLPEPSD